MTEKQRFRKSRLIQNFPLLHGTFLDPYLHCIITSISLDVFFLFHIRYDELSIFISNDLFGGLAFLHLWMQLAWYSFHINCTIEQFRWYYVLDHVLAFQLWYIRHPPVTHFECWSVYDTDSVWCVRFYWNLILELEKGTKCWWVDGMFLSFVILRAFPGREHHYQWYGCSVP